MNYTPPKAHILHFASNDIITASTTISPGEFNDENVDNGGWLLSKAPDII